MCSFGKCLVVQHSDHLQQQCTCLTAMYMCFADKLITRLLTGLACQLFPIVCYILLLCIHPFVLGKQQKQMFKPGLIYKLHNSIAVNEGISLMYAQVRAILTTELWLIVQTA